MIVFSDFDHTLFLHNDAEGTAKNLAAVQAFRASGNKFCIASGRSFSSFCEVLPNFSDYVDYLILENGAICLENNGAKKFEFNIPKQTVIDILNFLKENLSNVEIGYDFCYDMSEFPTFDNDIAKLRCWLRDVPSTELVTAELLKNFGDKIKAYIGIVTMKPGLEWLEGDFEKIIDIAPIEAGKENAIAKLSSMVAPGEEIITAGDSTNDCAMLTKFNGYAVANADPEILAVVEKDHVVATVSELLEKFAK